MVPDLTLEVIYLDQPTDFKMEFELCSSSNIRFLSLPVKSHSEFLNVLSKSVVRSRAIITVGSFNPLDKLYIPKIIAKATGFELEAVEKEKFAINSKDSVLLPKSSLPLVDFNGNLGGCVLESNDQSIIMLTSDKELRQHIVTNLVCPYLKLFANKKTFSDPTVEENVKSLPSEDETLSQDKSTENRVEPVQVTEPVVAEPVIAEPATDIEAELNVAPVLVGTPVLNETPNSSVEPPKNENSQFDLDGFLIDDDFEKSKPKKLKVILKILISIILVLVLLFASYFGYGFFFKPENNESAYEGIRKLYGQEWDELPEDMLYKFGKLYQTNSDIYGWLSIPNTNINLPVVTSASKSPSYYNSHLFDGRENNCGTLYTPSKVIKDYHKNLVIYGKNVGDGTMLCELEKFLELENYQNTPTFTYDTVYRENVWKIFSVFEISAEDNNQCFNTDFSSDTEFLEHISFLEENSEIDTNVDVIDADNILTLVAQGEERNLVLVARRVRSGESPMVDVTDATEIDDNQNSSDLPAVVQPLKPIEDSSLNSESSDMVDSNMVDGASSRFEQQAPVSDIIVKPTTPIISSIPDISSQSSLSSKTPTSSVMATSSKVSTSSKVPTSSIKPSTSSKNTTPSNIPNKNKLPILTVTNTFNGAKVSGNALDIIAQNIEAEMGPSYHIEALKAQAVAAYSWLLNNGSANNKYPSLPLKNPSQKCIDAVNAVAGQVAVYGDKVATTFYYAISAGKTAYAQDIWGGAYPHLVSVDSSVDKNVSGYQTQRTYSAETVAKIAKDLLKIDLNTIEDKNKWFTCKYDVNGLYCTKVKIGSVEKKGTYLRDTFFTASRVGSSKVLRSSAYTISYDEDGENFIFTVKGYGHGVGMSQAGANQYAKKGWNYEKILKHYFQGISIGTYYVN